MSSSANMVTALARKVIRVDGSEELIHQRLSMDRLSALIKAACMDTVNLRDPGQHVMLVDDQGQWKRLPVNEKATKLYWSVCKPGTRHMIRGDVVIVPDADFGSLS